MKKVLVTGVAGFIGMHTAQRLRNDGFEVVGLDNLNTYYSVDLKLARLHKLGIPTRRAQYNKLLEGTEGISFIQLDITDYEKLHQLMIEQKFDYIIHLAAQAGVRYSIENPHAYIDSNIKGYLNILEGCLHTNVEHIIYASSSSVYGLNKDEVFEEDHKTETQVSLYAATKKANEAMAHSYASVHKLPLTGLRFFTVYGPWGRPDMALFKFTERILNDTPIDVYNRGNLSRDFTYIDDIVEGIVRLIPHRPSGEIPYQVFNIGSNRPVKLAEFIDCLEHELGKKAKLNMLEMQPGDVERTNANTSKLQKAVGYEPSTSLADGVHEFVKWYRSYYNQ